MAYLLQTAARKPLHNNIVTLTKFWPTLSHNYYTVIAQIQTAED